jgi:hypothetical protein
VCLETKRRFALAVGSDVRAGCTGVSLGYGECVVQNRIGGHDAQFTMHRQLTGWGNNMATGELLQYSFNEPLALYSVSHRKRQVPPNQTKPRKCPNVRPIIPTSYNFQTARINMKFYVYCRTFRLNSDSDFCRSSRIITQQEFWNSPLLLWFASVSSCVPFSVAPRPVHYVCVCCNARHTEQICTTQVTVFSSILATYR